MSLLKINNLVHPDVPGPAITFDSNGNIKVDTDVIFVNSSGNRLGFGTATPSSTLEFAGAGVKFSGGFIKEKYHETGAQLAATQAHYLQTANTWYHNTAATATWTYNITYSSGTTLNSKMADNQSVTAICWVPITDAGQYLSQLQIDGSNVTPEWVDENAPIQAGGVEEVATTGTDVYVFQIIKTADATFNVFASHNHFE